MKQYEKCHPKRIEKLDSDIKICKEACERWTDNLFETQKYLKNMTGMQTSETEESFPIFADLDYFEWLTVKDDLVN